MVNESAKAHYQQARQRWDAGDRSGAQSLYRSALDADPSFALPHFDLGSLLETSDPPASRGHYAKFIELAAGDARLAGLVGQAAQKLAATPQPPTPRAPAPAPPPGQQARKKAPSRRPRKLGWVVLIWWLIGTAVVLAIVVGNLLAS